MRVVERDFNLQELMNWGIIICGVSGAEKIAHRWIFTASMLAIFFLYNYKLAFGPESTTRQPVTKSRKRFYYLPSFWILGGLAAYFVYAVIHTGWIFWFLLLSGTAGAVVATLLRQREA
jgi:hypothetical protein